MRQSMNKFIKEELKEDVETFDLEGINYFTNIQIKTENTIIFGYFFIIVLYFSYQNKMQNYYQRENKPKEKYNWKLHMKFRSSSLSQPDDACQSTGTCMIIFIIMYKKKKKTVA